MDNPDISMSDAESDDGLLAYGIPYPPQLDETLRFNDNSEEPPDWKEHAKYIGARNRPDGKGFEVRYINFNDPSGEGRYFDNDWPLEFRLGAPNDKWLYWNEVVQKWGLQVLDRAGFLNYEVDLPDDWFMNPYGPYALTLNPTKQLAERIHPVFRREMWMTMTDTQYKLITPALMLASAFLDDPRTLCLFHAMSAPPEQMITFMDRKLGWCKRLVVPDTLNESELEAAYDKMAAMRQWTTFYWESPQVLGPEGALARTIQQKDPDGGYIEASRPFTRQSKIGMSSVYLAIMQKYNSRSNDTRFNAYFEELLEKADVPENRKPEDFHLDSAVSRATLMFATLLIHEFAHAFSRAYFQRPVLAPPLSLPREPWLADNRSNELGFAVTDFILGGIPRPSITFRVSDPIYREHSQSYYAPFGLYFLKNWGSWETTAPNHSILEHGEAENFSTPKTFYPIAQQQVYDMFTKEFWEDEVLRNGSRTALKLEALPEWAAHKVPGPDPRNPYHGHTLR